MSYEARKEEMVGRYCIFDNEIYDNLYSKFGGHVMFYKEFWNLHNIGNCTYNDSIKFLIKEAKLILNVCLMTKKQEDIKPLLIQLRDSNFSIEVWYLTPTIRDLIKCNLLFYNAEKGVLTVQNRLLEKVILDYLLRDI